MTARFAALLGVLLVLACCAVPGSAAPRSFIEGSTLHTMNFGGLDRSYRLYIPAGLASPAPLAVMMHGGFGSAQQAERAYGWDELADSAKFVVAIPTVSARPGTSTAGAVAGRAGRTSTTSDSSTRSSSTSPTTSTSIRTGATQPASATAACWHTRWRATPAPSLRSVPTRPPNSTPARRRTRSR